MFRTVPLSIIGSYSTVHSAMVYVILKFLQMGKITVFIIITKYATLVRFQIVSLEFSIDIIVTIALWPWVRRSL
jgi:hypothetical protein